LEEGKDALREVLEILAVSQELAVKERQSWMSIM
jgi:hypothetical protein